MGDMNAGIILSGTQPNILGAMMQGNQAAAQTNGIRQQNALADLYKSQGAGIAQGDPNALNALAGIDPFAAQQAAGTAQDQQFSMEKMRMLRATAKEQAAAKVASMNAAEAAAEAAKIEKAVAAGMAAQSPAEWDAMVTQFGAPDLVGQFKNKTAIAFSYMGVADALKEAKGPEPADEYERYTQEEIARGNQPLDRIGYAQAKKGQEIIYGPDGNPIVVRGGVGSGKPFTEGQSKDIVFATRAEGALVKLEENANLLAGRVDGALERVPLGFGREIQDPKYQVAKAAGTEFLQAILRKDTGAAITPAETAEYGGLYLPQPGDDETALAYRSEARRRAVAAMKAGMPADAIVAQEKALSANKLPAGISPDDDALIQKYLGASGQ